MVSAAAQHQVDAVEGPQAHRDDQHCRLSVQQPNRVVKRGCARNGVSGAPQPRHALRDGCLVNIHDQH
jgi:hypothetical protein